MGLNLIEFDARYPEQKTFVINELIKIFDKLYDLKRPAARCLSNICATLYY